MWIEILWLNLIFFFNFLLSRKWEKNARNLTCFVKTQNLKVIIERKENQEKSLLKKINTLAMPIYLKRIFFEK
jgi:hypothetical protein